MSEPAELTVFRKGVQKIFADGLKLTFVPGLLEGPNMSGAWQGSCYARRLYAVSNEVDEANIDLVVRIFRPFEQPSPNIPFDPEPLEKVGDEFFAVVARNQNDLPGGAWYMRLTSFEIDVDKQGVECKLVAWEKNPAGV